MRRALRKSVQLRNGFDGVVEAFKQQLSVWTDPRKESRQEIVESIKSLEEQRDDATAAEKTELEKDIKRLNTELKKVAIIETERDRAIREAMQAKMVGFVAAGRRR